MLFDDLFLSIPALICFDDDPVDPPADPTDPPKTFTQEQVNKMLAEDKRKHKAQLEKTESNLAEILESKNLSEAERAKAEEAREDILKQLRTKEEQARLDKKKLEIEYEGRLSAAEKRAKEAEAKYEDATITRALQDAAVAEDAFNPSVLVTYLKGDTKFRDGNVIVSVPIVKEDGSVEEGAMTPAEAVKHMKDDPERFGGLFKSNIVSGVGGSGSPNSGKNGKVDVRKITTAEYMRLRKENPAALGL